MILGDLNTPHLDGEPVTLDDLFRIAGVRQPDSIALCDPPNRASFTDGEPRRLTYAQADHIVSAIAGRLRRLGLSTDAIVAVQLPNIVEGALTLLGILRAGMIAAPLPLLWRRTDAAAALNRIGAKAIVTTSRVGATNHCEIAMNVAVDVFPIRYVCSFGDNLTDGVIPFDDVMGSTPLLDPPIPAVRTGPPAAHIAAVTFEVTPSGLVAVARNHSELIAGGRAVRDEAALSQNAAILAACGTSSFAGLSAGMLPWLLTGGRLMLHQPFDPAVLAEQCSNERCDTVVVPGALASRIAQAALLGQHTLRHVVALWRTPERLGIGEAWPLPNIRLVDVQAFGETAVICRRRSASGEPADIPLGPVFASHNTADDGALAIAETAVTPAGTLAIRGPMVPRQPFPPGVERTPTACLKPDADGFVDTFYACRADLDDGVLQISGPPPGIINVGGYRFTEAQLQEMAGQTTGQPVITPLPDALAGHRLAGSADNRAAVHQALDALGLNPLISGAFQGRRKPQAA